MDGAPANVEGPPGLGPHPEEIYHGARREPRAPLPGEIASVPLFRGDDTDDHDARHWLTIVDRYSRLWNWTEEAKFVVADTRMTGPAHHWMNSITHPLTWTEFEQEFVERFGERPETALDRLATCRQEENEAVHSYADRFRRDMHLAGRIEDAALRYQFINKLHSRLKIEVKRQEGTLRTLADIVALAKKWEDYYEDERKHRETRKENRIPGNSQPYTPPYRREPSTYPPNNRQPEPQRQPDYRYPMGASQRPNNYNGNRPNSSNQGIGAYRNNLSRPATNYNRPQGPEQNRPNDMNRNRPQEQNRPYVPRENSNPPAATRGPADAAMEEITQRLKNLELSYAQGAQPGYRTREVHFFEPACMMIGEEGAEESTNRETHSRLSTEDRVFLSQEIQRIIQRELAQQKEIPAELDLMGLPPAMQVQAPETLQVPFVQHPAANDSYNFNETLEPAANLICPEELELSAAPDSEWEDETPLNQMTINRPEEPLSNHTLFMDYVSDEDEDWQGPPLYEAQHWGYQEDPAINYTTEPMYMKRPADEGTYQRMPRKRVAFETPAAGTPGPSRPGPSTPSPYSGQRPAGPSNPNRAPASNQAAPRQNNLRVPPPQRPQAPGALPGAQAPRVPLTDPTRRADLLSNLPADVLADSKGKEMAIKACRSLTVDAATDANLVIPAAKLCSAGHIINDSQLIEKGKDLARKTENFIRRNSTTGASAAGASGAGPSNAAAMQVNHFHPTQSASPSYTLLARKDPNPKMLSEDPLEEDSDDPSMRPARMSNLRAKVRIGSPSMGVVFETTAIVDTGASQCAVTLTTLKRMGLGKAYNYTKKTAYTTASGERAHSLGTLPDFPVSIGKLTTKVDFNVTDALTYDVLLGLDFLKIIGAVINLRTDRMAYELNNELEGIAEVSCLAFQTVANQATLNVMQDEFEEGEVEPTTEPAVQQETTTEQASAEEKQEGAGKAAMEAEDSIWEQFWSIYNDPEIFQPSSHLTPTAKAPTPETPTTHEGKAYTVEEQQWPTMIPIPVPIPIKAENEARTDNESTLDCTMFEIDLGPGEDDSSYSADWQDGEDSDDPLEDPMAPWPIPEDNPSAPIQVPLTEPTILSPNWLELMAREVIPWTYNGAAMSDVSELVGGERALRWLLIFFMLERHGYDYLQQNPDITASMARKLSTDEEFICALINLYKSTACTYAAIELFKQYRGEPPHTLAYDIMSQKFLVPVEGIKGQYEEINRQPQKENRKRTCACSEEPCTKKVKYITSEPTFTAEPLFCTMEASANPDEAEDSRASSISAPMETSTAREQPSSMLSTLTLGDTVNTQTDTDLGKATAETPDSSDDCWDEWDNQWEDDDDDEEIANPDDWSGDDHVNYMLPVWEWQEKQDEEPRPTSTNTGPSVSENPAYDPLRSHYKRLYGPRISFYSLNCLGLESPPRYDSEVPTDKPWDFVPLDPEHHPPPIITIQVPMDKPTDELCCTWVEVMANEVIPWIFSTEVMDNVGYWVADHITLKWLLIFFLLRHYSLEPLRQPESMGNPLCLAAVKLGIPFSEVKNSMEQWIELASTYAANQLLKISRVPLVSYKGARMACEVYGRRFLLPAKKIYDECECLWRQKARHFWNKGKEHGAEKEVTPEQPAVETPQAEREPEATTARDITPLYTSASKEEPIICMMEAAADTEETYYEEGSSTVSPQAWGYSFGESRELPHLVSTSDDFDNEEVWGDCSPEQETAEIIPYSELLSSLEEKYIVTSSDEEEIEVGAPLYNSGELPPLAQPTQILSCDDIKLGRDLTNDQREALRNLLWQNEDVFAFTPQQLGYSDIVRFDITLKEGANPVTAPYTRIPYKYWDALKAEIDKMLELGLVRPSASEWSAPVLMVPKKDGTYRLVMDFRKQNELVVKQAYPIMQLDDILSQLGGAKWFCSLDATKGFLQIACTPEASQICAFTTPFGLYEPTVMLMGLKNAPPVWQRAMNIGLAEHINKRMFVYMDDAIIYASTFAELLVNIRLVLASFRKMGIKLSPIKSQFGVTSLKFLGHHITPEGIRPDDSILKTIRDYPWPKEKVHVQRFLGLTNWLRKYIKDYARIAAPLTDLTGNVPFEFGTWQIAAMEELKKRLMEPPILRHPDLNQPFILKTDACRLGFGGILAQKDEETGKEYVVRYGSKRTTGPERNYSATDLECAAVGHFIKKWHVFLAGGRFTLITDHQALKYLMTAKDLTGRLARWAIKLQEYEFDIVYRKGKEHGDVDALSRAVGQEEESLPWEQWLYPEDSKQPQDEPTAAIDGHTEPQLLYQEETAPAEDTTHQASRTTTSPTPGLGRACLDGTEQGWDETNASCTRKPAEGKSQHISTNLEGPKTLIAIEGNIGAGKSSVVESLKREWLD